MLIFVKKKRFQCAFYTFFNVPYEAFNDFVVKKIVDKVSKICKN